MPLPRTPAAGQGLVLRVATSPAWLPGALAALDEVLVDHAHCEKKAAANDYPSRFRK